MDVRTTTRRQIAPSLSEGCVCPKLRDKIVSEAYDTPYVAHPGSTKLYQDLKF